jgi:hypothetical protein
MGDECNPELSAVHKTYADISDVHVPHQSLFAILPSGAVSQQYYEGMSDLSDPHEEMKRSLSFVILGSFSCF